ncbi:flagellar hook capping protein [Natranaerovirga pectinivora]|uniref:Basal-body rod modification protein FlgD n=1 Tax=Natranaerovirga pectinivora TaxID=682400 RepID=A0A4R3MR56_9FIRM|nr:flagellar hook capping FlgD N-terminal domain-containing protein [Natranaerovirga pectinivora]TCT16426.1 flagellar hook capping protein [Natranaerovirga pectinivora]
MSSVNDVQKMLMQSYNPQQTKNSNNDLGKDAFLQLLVTQMRYQDPLNPTSDTDFLAQMAQFSALEQMQNINTTMMAQQGYALIGKDVIAITVNPFTNEVTEVEGIVEAVNVVNGKVQLQVNDVTVSLDEVKLVYNEGDIVNQMAKLSTLDAIKALNQNILTQQKLSLIGKHVLVKTVDPDTQETVVTEGKVESVKVSNGKTYLQVNNKLLNLEDVESVSENEASSI